MKKAKPIYFNRELSWLSFNQRVLNQASDERHPLLERVKFLAITASNLDEFFRVRVGGLKLVAHDETQTDLSGLVPREQLREIRLRVRAMISEQSTILADLEKKLEPKEIKRVLAADVTDAERELLLKRFKAETVSAVTPTAVENSLNLSFLRVARLTVCVRLKNDPTTTLHPVEDTDASSTLRITRNGDVKLIEDGRADLLLGMQDMLNARTSSGCVRMELSSATSPQMRAFLESTIAVEPDDVYLVDGPMSLSDYFSLASVQGFSELKDKPWQPQPAPNQNLGERIFESIAEGDQLLYHPYQSYGPVIDFIN